MTAIISDTADALRCIVALVFLIFLRENFFLQPVAQRKRKIFALAQFAHFSQLLNKSMKISEIAQPLQSFIATVRVVLPHMTITARILALADNYLCAKVMLAEKYGSENVLTLSQTEHERIVDETTTAPLSAAELQVKSMRDRAKQLNQQARQVKARSKLQKAQHNLFKAHQPPSTN